VYAGVRTINDPAEVARQLFLPSFPHATAAAPQPWKPSSTLTTLMPTSATA
jgi:hypothetical protein